MCVLRGLPVVLGIHIGMPHIINTNAGSTSMGIVMFHGSNSMRLLDPLADFVLGLKVTLAAGTGDCPYGETQDCTKHYVIGSIILAASVVDYLLNTVNFLAIHHIFKHDSSSQEHLQQMHVAECLFATLLIVLLALKPRGVQER